MIFPFCECLTKYKKGTNFICFIQRNTCTAIGLARAKLSLQYVYTKAYGTFGTWMCVGLFTFGVRFSLFVIFLFYV